MTMSDFLNALVIFDKLNLINQKQKVVKAIELMVDKGIAQLEEEIKVEETEEVADA